MSAEHAARVQTWKDMAADEAFQRLARGLLSLPVCISILTNKWAVKAWGLEMPPKCVGLLVWQRRATQFKVLGKENTWFVEGKLKTQGQEAGGNEL